MAAFQLKELSARGPAVDQIACDSEGEPFPLFKDLPCIEKLQGSVSTAPQT